MYASTLESAAPTEFMVWLWACSQSNNIHCQLSWCSFLYRVTKNYLYMFTVFALRRMAFYKIMKHAGLYHKEFSFPLIGYQTVL